MTPFRSGDLEPEPGLRVRYDQHDGDGPAYLFLHGLGSVRQGEKSEALRRHAAARGRAFARFDFRGHGESGGRIGHATISELIADAERMLGLTGRAILFGSSLGGLVAAFTATRRPDLVAGLVLLAPALGFLQRMERRLDRDGRLRAGEAHFTVDPRVLADAIRLDEAALPGRITAPTLVVHGARDDVVPPTLSEGLFAGLAAPRKELWIVPDGDHRLNQPIAEILRRMDRLLG